MGSLKPSNRGMHQHTLCEVAPLSIASPDNAFFIYLAAPGLERHYSNACSENSFKCGGLGAVEVVGPLSCWLQFLFSFFLQAKRHLHELSI
jgi:hypothetical protein